MNTPPLLLGMTLLFWGWQAGFLWFSVAGAIILEGSRLFKVRWDLSHSDLQRVVYLCDFLLIVGIVYVFATTGRANFVDAILSLFRALPLAVLPLIIAQTYSIANKIDINTLTLVSKRKSARKKDRRPRLVDISYPYFAVCLLSASMANMKTPWFYAGFALLAAWALWAHRPRMFSPVIWIILLVSVGGLGYIGYLKLYDLQAIVESFAVSIQTPGETPDAYKSKTAIGRIGELKLSDRVLLRVKADAQAARAPFLLQDAGYDSYGASTWFARGSVFEPVKPGQNRGAWALQNIPVPEKSMSISAYLKRGKGILALPHGASQIENLPVGEMKQSALGTVTVDEGPVLVNYTVRFDPDAPRSAPPRDADLKVPHNMSPVFLKIVDGLRLKTKSPRQIVQAVTGYFTDSFQYSTYKKGLAAGSDPVEDFLFRSRSGHCEYFATSTVLLLRASGVPARYATGYSVQEFSPLEKAYIVRSKHAHAWALAYVDGAWRDVDTTPSSWYEAEKNASGFRALSDMWAWLVHGISRLLWGDHNSRYAYYFIWLAVPVVIIFVWRLYLKKRVFLRNTKQKQEGIILPQKGKDSEFYAIESELTRRGLGRHTWEPVSMWINRICPDTVMPDLLKRIVSLHYRYRFDPDGLRPQEREALKEAARTWLSRNKGKTGPKEAENAPGKRETNG